MPQVLFSAQNSAQLVNYCISILNDTTTVEAKFKALSFAVNDLLIHLVNNNDVFQTVFSQCQHTHLLAVCLETLDQDEQYTEMIFDACQIIAHNPNLDIRTLIRSLPASLVSYVIDTINDANPDIILQCDLNMLLINNEELNLQLVSYFEPDQVRQTEYIFHRASELKHVNLMAKLSEYNVNPNVIDVIKTWTALDYYLYDNHMDDELFRQGLNYLTCCPITDQTMIRIRSLSIDKQNIMKQMWQI